jgi:hypothetical protein
MRAKEQGMDDDREGRKQEGDLPPDVRPLVIEFDQANQRVRLKFEKGDFLTWDYILAVIDMGRQFAEEEKRSVIEQNRAAQRQKRIVGGL